MTHWIVPVFMITSSILFIACWAPLLMGWVTNPWASGVLGILSGVPFSVAIPFVLYRIADGAWVWDL